MDIKFRIWWRSGWGSGTMETSEDWALTTEGDLLCLDSDLEGSGVSGYSKVSGRTDYQTMLWTGTLDKTGKEVYEGDIVEIEGAGRCKVVYMPANMKFFFELLAPKGDSFIAPPEKVEVLGNIYENKELLTV